MKCNRNKHDSHHYNFFSEAGEMKKADEELRETVKQIWPLQAKKILDLLIPRHDGKQISKEFTMHLVCLSVLLMKQIIESPLKNNNP